MRAIETGFSVSFYRLDELMHQLKKDAELAPSRLKHRKYMAVNLVIIDEFGYQAVTREEANLFFRVVNYRYSKGSGPPTTTTNKRIASWPSVLAGDEVLAGAILDRLLHNATVLNIHGRSYRLKELDAQISEVQKTPPIPPDSSALTTPTEKGLDRGARQARQGSTGVRPEWHFRFCSKDLRHAGGGR